MNKNKKNIFSIFSENEIYLISSFFGFILGLLLFTFFTPNYYKQKAPVQLDIPKGLSLSQVVDSLYVKEIIPSRANMRIAAFIYGAESKIKAGRYEIPNGLSYLGLLDLLLKGSPKEEVLVTIPEGIWQRNLAKLLHEELNVDSAKFIQLSQDKEFIESLGLNTDDLEGYLLPETYYFYEDSSPEEVIKKLYREMNNYFSDTIKARMQELKLDEKEVLTLASIIDGESNKVDEFGKISAVYHNRLKRGMKLQADPTIQYLIRDKRYNRIYYKDLEIDSPFNTYKYYGLPPAPINNPGKDAIHAALYPDSNNYYYFVAAGDGGHVFARTFSQHLRNVRNYRRWRNSQK